MLMCTIKLLIMLLWEMCCNNLNVGYLESFVYLSVDGLVCKFSSFSFNIFQTEPTTTVNNNIIDVKSNKVHLLRRRGVCCVSVIVTITCNLDR
jgi:hypothetical protein